MIDISKINKDYILNIDSVDYTNTEALPKRPGVYIFYIEVPDFKCLYIGKSEYIVNRIASHNHLHYFNFLETCGIQVKLASVTNGFNSDEDLIILEQIFINKFIPVLNHYSNPFKKKDFKTLANKDIVNLKTETDKKDIKLKSGLEKMDIRTLKKLARILNIKHYSYMNYKTLYLMIEQQSGMTPMDFYLKNKDIYS